MKGSRLAFASDGYVLEGLAVALAAWLAAGAVRAELDLIRQAIGLLLNV